MTSVEDINKVYREQEKNITTLGVFVSSLNAANTDLKRHCGNCKRAAEREHKKSCADKEKEALASAKKAALETAVQIKARQTDALKVSSLFTLAQTLFVQVEVATSIADWNKLVAADSSVPAKFTESDDVKTFLGIELIQKVLVNFGSSYKKTKSCRDVGWHNGPLLPKQGNEEFEELVAKFATFPQKESLRCCQLSKMRPGCMGKRRRFHVLRPYHQQLDSCACK